MDFLAKYLEWICGQATDRSWVFGSQTFPLCQRCTGIYVGAAIATILYYCMRPRAQRGGLWILMVLLFQIVPAGLHWWFDTPVLRMLSGAWFGIGVIGLLYRQAMPNRNVASHLRRRKEWPAILSAFLIAGALAQLVQDHEVITGALCFALAIAGLISVIVLVSVNLFALASTAARLITARARVTATVSNDKSAAQHLLSTQ